MTISGPSSSPGWGMRSGSFISGCGTADSRGAALNCIVPLWPKFVPMPRLRPSIGSSSAAC